MTGTFNIQAAIKRVSELEDAVREHINTHRHQVELLNDNMTWNQICSSLDVIGDSLLAIQSYIDNPFPSDTGLRYIFTYGILQALFLQQDAIAHLAEALGVVYKRSQTLSKIRRVRNAAIGHPTKQSVGEGREKERYYNYISRISMNKSGFHLMRHSEKQTHSIEDVDLSKAIEEQLAAVIEGYELIVEKLDDLERMHMQKFEGKLLADCFPDSMTYHLSKVGEGIYSGHQEFGIANLRIIRNSYETFRGNLVERKELSTYTDFDLAELFHAMDQLHRYLSREAPHMNEHDARIYLKYLSTQHEHFLLVAHEIDQDYLTIK